MQRVFLILISTLLVAGCDCSRYTSGYIVDEETKEAIVGAKIISFAALDDRQRDERVQYSDGVGRFEAAFKLNSVAKCGNLKLTISKPGYVTVRRVDHIPEDTIFIKKQY